MRSFILIATIALVAGPFALVRSDDSLQKSLGVSDAELARRENLMNEIKELKLWNDFTAIQQQKLTKAVITDAPVPLLWLKVRHYPEIVDPKNADFMEKLHNNERLRNFMMYLLPSVPHEDTVRAAEKQAWFKDLSAEEQKAVSLLILQEQNVPEGFSSWSEAVKSDNLGEWIKENKDKLSA